ncbi:MAG: sigma 54-interacting transcriptional regulator, partial [Myxococcota bacterium]
MPKLIVQLQSGDAREFPLLKRITSIGKGSGNDVIVDDPGLPETAAVLTRDGAAWLLEPLAGATILVDGRKRAEHDLAAGSSVTLGAAVISLSMDDSCAEKKQQRGAGAALSATRFGRGEEALTALSQLHSFSKRLLSEHDLPRLLEELMDAVVEVTGADKGFLILAEDDELSVKVARNLAKENIEDAVSRVSDTIISRVMSEKRPLIVSDALNHEEFRSSESVVNLKLCSVMCAPLTEKGELIGLIYVGNDSIVDLFEPPDLEVLTVFAGQASLIVSNALLVDSLRRETKLLRRMLEEQRFGEIIGSCDAMRDVFRRIDKVAGTDISVLVTGETGTGKELVAREIHRRGPRSESPFVAINCGAIPENLLESELFGHVRGAFTGATSTRQGRFQAASGGTLFLDEIGELPVALQVKLLRAIQEKTVTKVGDTRPEPVDIRIVAATNKDLEQEIRAGTFREDLYYRLNVITIHLPPLRERGDDVLVIARYLLERYAKEYGSRVRGFSPAAVK